MAEFRQGPSPVEYNPEPMPRVTGEDLNGSCGGEEDFGTAKLADEATLLSGDQMRKEPLPCGGEGSPKAKGDNPDRSI